MVAGALDPQLHAQKPKFSVADLVLWHRSTTWTFTFDSSACPRSHLPVHQERVRLRQIPKLQNAIFKFICRLLVTV